MAEEVDWYKLGEFGDDYDDMEDLLEEYYNDAESGKTEDNDELDLTFRYCYQSLIQGGYGVLIISYLIASFIYFFTFTKSLRWYLLLKCIVVVISNAFSISAIAVVLMSYEDSVFNTGFYKYFTRFRKFIYVGNFLVYNLNFLFQYDIYCMVCQSVTFSENLAVKLIAAFFFALLPAASTFRYDLMDFFKFAEEFCLETSYMSLLFFFMVFFIHKIRKAFIKSMEIRSNSTASSSSDRQRLKKIFYFLIAMAIVHLLYMVPRVFDSVIRFIIYSIGEKKCDRFADDCLGRISRLSCISYLRDVFHIFVAFVDLFPFFVFMKLDKLKLC